MIRYLITAALAVALFACAIGFAEGDLSRGSANTPVGTTLIVSVFAGDRNYVWDFDTEADRQTRSDILDYLSVAAHYLSGAVWGYGKACTFIYDFETCNDLYYEAAFDADITGEDAEACMNRFLDETVDSDGLRLKYGADNIIYFMFANTDAECRAITCTRNYYEGMEHPYEIVFLYNVDEGAVNCPAVYAHEIMHTFGVPDLYYTDEAFGITPEFLDYVSNYMPNDLMYSCSDSESGDYVYDRITNELSELDAYYAGLTDHCDLAERFHLKNNEHFASDR